MTTTPNNPARHPHSLLAHFQDLPDPRINRTKDHDLIDVLIIGLCTLLCAGETFNDMADFGLAKQDWFKTFLALRNGIPSHDTFNRVFAALDPKRFLECFLNWTQSVRQAVPQEIVALDGKALRRALAKDQSVQYVVSAWAEGNGLVLGQLKVADKSNEITAVPELLRVLELAGCIVTLDAMGCQKKIAREIVEADADSVGMVESSRELAGKTTVERRYYLSSLKLDVQTFARAVRGHWGVENKLHWVLDVCFHEDQSRAREGYAAENLATLRRLALNVLKREKTKKRGIRGKMLNASWEHPYLLRLLGVEPKEI